MNKALRILLFSSVLVFLMLPSLASALDFDPVDGLWIINEENNGKPGRGFQIEIQNEFIVLTFYGYDQTGADAWWLASGSFPAGSNQITMALGAYEGGMAFGDSLQDATYLGPEGQVTISFNSGNSGAICLPGEPCKAINKFNFGYSPTAVSLGGAWGGSSTSVRGCKATLDAKLDHVANTTNISGTLTVIGGAGCIAPYFTTSVDGYVDGTNFVLGTVTQGAAEVLFKGTLLSNNSVSGTWASLDLLDAGNWSLQR